MRRVTTPIEQEGYNAYGYVDGERVPVLSTSMGSCWGQDDQRAFCGHIVHCVNNHERLVEALRNTLRVLDGESGTYSINRDRKLLAQLQAGKGGE